MDWTTIVLAAMACVQAVALAYFARNVGRTTRETKTSSSSGRPRRDGDELNGSAE